MIFCRLAPLFVVHDLLPTGLTLTAAPQSVLLVALSGLLGLHLVELPWLLAVPLPRRRLPHLSHLSPMQLRNQKFVSFWSDKLSASTRPNQRTMCGRVLTVYLVVVNVPAIPRHCRDPPLLDRPLRHIQPCSASYITHRVHADDVTVAVVGLYRTSLLPLILL